MDKNFEKVLFLRNKYLFANHSEAESQINANSDKAVDGEVMLARYRSNDNKIKTIVGYKYKLNGEESFTLFDNEKIEESISRKADINQIPDVSNYIDGVEYESDGANHSIVFYHGSTYIDSIDATPFLKDGMISDVRVENGNLIIDFNTDSGIEDISIPLTEFFDPELYYSKTEVDALLAEKESEIYSLKKIVGDIGGDVTYDLPGEGKSFNTLMNNNGTVKLSEDVATGRFGPGITAKNTVKLNLNSHNLAITGLTTSSAQAAILARGSQNITIGGKGTIDAGQGVCIETSSANAVINLTGSTTIYQTNRPNAELIYCYTGTINITNGTFKNNGSPYLLNCYDANYRSGTANIIVTGGKFYDFNPMDNSAEGEHTNFLAEGYHVEISTVVEDEVEHTVYTVKKD